MDSSHLRWNRFNQEKKPEKVKGQEGGREVEVFAAPPEDKAPRGWLCDLINIFGEVGGFRSLHRRICERTETLTVMLAAAQIRCGVCVCCVCVLCACVCACVHVCVCVCVCV